MYTYLLKSSLAFSIASLFFISCGKDNIEIVPPGFDTVEFISNIEGNREYTGFSQGASSYDTIERAVLEIEALSSKNIRIGTTVINFINLDTINRIINFSKTVGSGSVGSTTLHYSVTYYFAKDSIVYFEASSTGHLTPNSRTLHTL